MWKPLTGLAVLAALVLGCAAARADDAHRPQDPDPGFLEFLGSVDRLADVNPNYLSPGDLSRSGARPARPGASGGTPTAVPPPAPSAPPRPALPPSASSGSGGPNNE